MAVARKYLIRAWGCRRRAAAIAPGEGHAARGVTQGHTFCQRHDHVGRPGMRSCSQEALALAAASWAACDTDPCPREAWLRQGLQSAKGRRAAKCQGQNAYGCCRGYTQRFGWNIGSHNK